MFTTLLTAALIIAPALHTVSAEFAMQVPELSQCKNARITWNATTGPYNLIIVPSNDPCGGDIIDDLERPMFEKFSNLNIDSTGRGGEYTVQAGIGWTNGVAL